MSTNTHSDTLVSTDWLAERLDDPTLRIIEVDEDNDAWRRSHIPGAIAWRWNEDLHDGVRRDYIDQERLSALLGRSGVGPETTIILYGGNNNWFASYAYWLLRYRGFDRVQLLDGGRKKWELEGRPLNAEVPAVPSSDYRIEGAERPELRAFRDEVLDSVGHAGFVDVRSPEEFSGAKLAPDHLPQEQPYVGGHVPGAANVPWSRAVNDDGTFRPADELRAIYAEQGITGDGETITYCRIGERSSHTWFALTQVLGFENVRNYDGSWTEYGSLVGVPVERGPAR
jgi:thiosulfate/3-mercaptopyruvate sulfurtransferase